MRMNETESNSEEEYAIQVIVEKHNMDLTIEDEQTPIYL